MVLGEMIKDYRYKHKIGIRKLAKEIGISHGTLSRIERGFSCDLKTLIKLLQWLAY